MKAVLFFLLFGLLQNTCFAQTNALPTVRPLQARGIENFFQLTGTIFSGAAPEGDEGFAELQKRGIKTIISVDGAKPDLTTAKKYGFRYVHLPFGYDGIPANQVTNLVKASKELARPIFVHCHHGLHRGPAGAAILCEGAEGWTPQQAVHWLQQAGTSTNYLGLYKSVEQFHLPSAEQLKKLPNDFPETTEVSSLVDTMVAIDERFDNLKLIKKADYKSPESDPDLVPAHEALLLQELFKELLREPQIQKREKHFVEGMTRAEQAAAELHALLNEPTLQRQKVDAAFEAINNSCASCHKTYRNVSARR